MQTLLLPSVSLQKMNMIGYSELFSKYDLFPTKLPCLALIGFIAES